MTKKILILLFILIPINANALIEVDITRGNLNPLPLAVSPLSIDEESRKGFEKILKKDSIHFDKLGMIESDQISYGNDLKISIDDIKEGYKKWLKDYMVN